MADYAAKLKELLRANQCRFERQGKGDQSFEKLKQSNDHEAEFWSARDLQPLLGYSQWRRFEDAIKRAIISCVQSGNNPGYHFAGAGKPIISGKGAAQTVERQHRRSFACDCCIFLKSKTLSALATNNA
jgi:hypothetical protein